VFLLGDGDGSCKIPARDMLQKIQLFDRERVLLCSFEVGTYELGSVWGNGLAVKYKMGHALESRVSWEVSMSKQDGLTVAAKPQNKLSQWSPFQ